MDKALKQSIRELAQKILEMNGVEEANEIQAVAKELYDAVTVLKFLGTHDSLLATTPTNKIIAEAQEPVVENVPEPENIEEIQMLSTLDENLFVSNEPMDESLMEPATEKIKDIVAQMPIEAEKIEAIIQEVVAPSAPIKDEEITAAPRQEDLLGADKQQSLNDRLKKSITIGLNDRIAFVKHLFNGSTEDFNRVISQLNTLSTELEALEFLNSMVKPEYNNWLGKEDYEQRFLSFIEGRYA